MTSSITNHNSVAQPDPGDLVPQQSGPSITIPKEQWERINKELKTLRENAKCMGLRQLIPTKPAARANADKSERESIHASSAQMGTVHFGSRSVLAMALGRSKSSQDAAKAMEENILLK